jgi:hypothetical protein
MPRLTLRRKIRHERGASAVLVALLMVPMFGFAAIAVDVAAVYSERRQLQNGADAAALAIGHDCADGVCDQVPQAVADELTGANYEEAGSTQGTPVVTLGSSEVTVMNPGVQGHWFAPVLGQDSSDVSASATVRWGAPGGGTAVLPLAFWRCEFEDQIQGLTLDDSGIPIHFTKSSDVQDCTGQSNLTVPGGFAWLATDPGVCGATTDIDGTVGSSTGNSVPTECTPEYFQSLIDQTVLLPIYDTFGGTGNNAWYGIYGYAAFTISGYNFGGQYKTNPPPCSGEERCIDGTYVKFVDLSDDFTVSPTAPDYGGLVVGLIA